MGHIAESLGDFTIPKKAAIKAIVRAWADRVPGWRTTSVDYRWAETLWKDCGKDMDTVHTVLDRAIQRCDAERFWARNRTLRFAASRVDELLNQGGDDERDGEFEAECWIRDVAIFQLRIDDREGFVRAAHKSLGTYERVRALIENYRANTPGSPDDEFIWASIQGAAGRNDRPGSDAPGSGGGRNGPRDSPF